jgi:DNA-binding response OmpR family regulator
LGKAKILVADDSTTLLKVVKTVLAQQGYDVVLASDGVEAIRKFYSERPDLVICDILMPKMNGYLVCRLLKEDWSAESVPFIMLTSQDAPSDRYRGLMTGADAYLSKDFDASVLIKSVEEALREAPPKPDVEEVEETRPELSDAEILARVSDMLDRKLYEATLIGQVNKLAAVSTDYGELVANILKLIASFIEYSMAGIALVGEESLGIAVNEPATYEDFKEVAAHIVENMNAYGEKSLAPEDVNVWAIDPDQNLGKAEEPIGPLQTFVCMPLRSQDSIVALLAVCSKRPNAFGEKELSTLRLIEPAVAVVVDNGRLYDQGKIG